MLYLEFILWILDHFPGLKDKYSSFSKEVKIGESDSVNELWIPFHESHNDSIENSHQYTVEKKHNLRLEGSHQHTFIFLLMMDACK